MSEDQGFEPYLDWSMIDEEMTDDLHAAIKSYRGATDAFLEAKSVEGARNVLKAQDRVSQVAQAIHQTIFTQPVMVHVAGQPKSERDEHGHDTIMQRCKRCGSVLQVWHENIMVLAEDGPREMTEDDVAWWSDGTWVAKHSDSGIVGVYEVENKDSGKLDKHEKMCPDFAEQFGS